MMSRFFSRDHGLARTGNVKASLPHGEEFLVEPLSDGKAVGSEVAL